MDLLVRGRVEWTRADLAVDPLLGAAVVSGRAGLLRPNALSLPLTSRTVLVARGARLEKGENVVNFRSFKLLPYYSCFVIHSKLFSFLPRSNRSLYKYFFRAEKLLNRNVLV